VVDDWKGTRRGDVEKTLLNINGDYDKLYRSEGLNMSRLLATPPPPPIGNGELISFSVTEEVSLRDILIELGRLAEVDMQIDPRINTGIILKVTEKPINVVIDKICDLANLKYEYDDGILKIERDLPYSVNYDISILVDHPLWDNVETSLQYIFETSPKVKQDPIATDDDTIPQEEETVEEKIMVNKPGGMVSVYTTKKTHTAISNYLEQMKNNYESQVLIEAKVVEVGLNDSFESGINWEVIKKGSVSVGDEGITVTNQFKGLDYAKSPSGVSSMSDITTPGIGATFSIGAGNFNLTSIINALSTFGQTKTLASPRLHTLNNQKATLEFVTPLVYFSVERTENGTNAQTGAIIYDYTSTKQEDEEGIKLDITPTINRRTKEITLTVVPELRNATGEVVKDPINEGNTIPIVTKKKLETSLKIKSGDVMVIGGLIQESTNKERNGIPFLKDIPILGYFFGYNSYSKRMNETVIFIKATIMDEFKPLTDKDRKMLDTFDR
jgi:general secretion pathway protein D